MRHLILVILLACSFSLNAQTDSTTIDLSRLVQQQIEIAKAKQLFTQTKKNEEISLGEQVVEEEKAEDENNLEVLPVKPDSVMETLAELYVEDKAEDKTEVKAEIRKPYVVRRITKPNSENSVVWKILLLFMASVAAAAIIIIRRKKLAQRELSDKNFKRNVMLIREERVIKKDNPYLKEIRQRLKDSAGRGKINEITVTDTARRLRISKEEILLANRIHLQEMMKA